MIALIFIYRSHTSIPGRRVCPLCNMAPFSWIVDLVAGWAENQTGRMQQFTDRENQHQDDDQRQMNQQAQAGNGCQLNTIKPEIKAFNWTMSL